MKNAIKNSFEKVDKNKIIKILKMRKDQLFLYKDFNSKTGKSLIYQILVIQ